MLISVLFIYFLPRSWRGSPPPNGERGAATSEFSNVPLTTGGRELPLPHLSRIIYHFSMKFLNICAVFAWVACGGIGDAALSVDNTALRGPTQDLQCPIAGPVRVSKTQLLICCGGVSSISPQHDGQLLPCDAASGVKPSVVIAPLKARPEPPPRPRLQRGYRCHMAQR